MRVPWEVCDFRGSLQLPGAAKYGRAELHNTDHAPVWYQLPSLDMSNKLRTTRLGSSGHFKMDCPEPTVQRAPVQLCVGRATSQLVGSTAMIPTLTSRARAPSPYSTRAPIRDSASSPDRCSSNRFAAHRHSCVCSTSSGGGHALMGAWRPPMNNHFKERARIRKRRYCPNLGPFRPIPLAVF